VSPDSYLAPGADVEAVDMESLLEISYQKGTMSDDDNDKALPKSKSIALHFMPSKMVYVSFDVETGGELCGIIQQKGTMSDDDDDKVIPKGKPIALHFMPSKMVYVS